MNHFCLGDLHGNIPAFRSVLNQIDLKPDDKAYIVGDAIDRRAGGIELVKEIMNSSQTELLLGNHEYMMRNVINAELVHSKGWRYENDKELWYANGGKVTHRNYLVLPRNEKTEIRDYLDALPVNIDLSIHDHPFKLVHAAPLEWYNNNLGYSGAIEFAVWHRWGSNYPQSKEYTIVFGHTPTEMFQDGTPMRIWHGENVCGIDCGAGYPDDSFDRYGVQGRLAAICLETCKEYYSEK